VEDYPWFGIVVVSDRGDLYLPECLANLNDVLPWTPTIVINDEAHRLGMAGAVRAGMREALDENWEYVLWVEEDFRFNERPPMEEMRTILDAAPHLAQVVLKRQPWSFEEHEAGGIVEMTPSAYTDLSLSGIHWLEHQRIFSLNPCLIPRPILQRGWPDGNEAEQTELLVSRGFHFAMYGKREDPPLVTHVGHERGQGWRL
jgi:hypothetical protein